MMMKSMIYAVVLRLRYQLSRWLAPGVLVPWFSRPSSSLAREPDGSFVAMSHHSSSAEVAAIRVAVEGICEQLLRQALKQARLIRSGAVGELTEADIEHMASEMAIEAHAQLDAAAPYCQSPSADPELQAACRLAAKIMAAAAGEVDTALREAWRARHEKVAGRRWRR